MTTPEWTEPIAPDEQIARMVAAAGEVGEPDPYAGKRQSTRFREGMRLEIALDPLRLNRSQAVFMHNISDGGFAFWSRQKMAPRTTLYVREFSDDDDLPWLPAHVTHCTVGIRGFLVGASFNHATPISSP
jgi:hypothetical protein